MVKNWRFQYFRGKLGKSKKQTNKQTKNRSFPLKTIEQAVMQLLNFRKINSNINNFYMNQTNFGAAVLQITEAANLIHKLDQI